jgi:hypothetical protein
VLLVLNTDSGDSKHCVCILLVCSLNTCRQTSSFYIIITPIKLQNSDDYSAIASLFSHRAAIQL